MPTKLGVLLGLGYATLATAGVLAAMTTPTWLLLVIVALGVGAAIGFVAGRLL